MNNKTIIFTAVGIILLIVVLFAAYKFTNTTAPTTYPEIAKLTQTDHMKWSSDKKNILIEYSDFQCPACKAFHDMMKPFEASGSPDFKISQNVTFVYRHFPLPQHINAMTAAYAAEAAGKQGKFFEMADSLFNTQTQWETLGNPTDFFAGLAKDLQLDIEKFKNYMNTSEVKQKVDSDLSLGNNVGINQTPTFFLNGKKLDNIQSFDDFKKLLLSL